MTKLVDVSVAKKKNYNPLKISLMIDYDYNGFSYIRFLIFAGSRPKNFLFVPISHPFRTYFLDTYPRSNL